MGDQTVDRIGYMMLYEPMNMGLYMLYITIIYDLFTNEHIGRLGYYWFNTSINIGL